MNNYNALYPLITIYIKALSEVLPNFLNFNFEVIYDPEMFLYLYGLVMNLYIVCIMVFNM